MSSKHKQNVIIYGTGEYGKLAYEILHNEYNIVAFSDSNIDRIGKNIKGIEIVSPDRINEFCFSSIIVAISRYREPAHSLVDRGLNNIRVFVPFYSKTNGSLTCELKDYYRKEAKKIDRQIIWNRPNKSQTKYNKNSFSNRKVLIIAPFFPPEGGGGVQRTLKFAKYLWRYGYEPVVLTKGYADLINGVDYSMESEKADFSCVTFQSVPVIFDEFDENDQNDLFSIIFEITKNKKMEERFLGEYAKKKDRILPDKWLIWTYNVIKELDNILDITTFDVVFTTMSPYSSSILGFYLKKKYGLKWVLDYRDSWTLNDYCMNTYYKGRMDSRELERDLEISLIKQTDYVVAASEVICEDIKKNVNAVRTKTITNGYDESDFNSIEPITMPYFQILYNGSVYANRDPSLMLEMINCLIEEGLIDSENIRIVFNGYIEKKVEALLIDKDKYNIVVMNGFLTHEKSIRMAMGANVLFLNGEYNEGAYYFYTGKIFEYIRTGKPIISFSSPYGVHYEMIEKTGLGITATQDDKEKIKAFVLRYYKAWKSGFVPEKGNHATGVFQFSREYLTGQLARVFEEVLQ